MKNFLKWKTKILGFTLIELMIVIAILGVLTAMISGNFITSLKKGRDARRKGDLEQIQRALEMYYEDKKAYPTFIFPFGGKFCETAACAATEKVYMQKVSNDPISSKSYEYVSSDGTNYKMYACLENNQQILPYSSVLTPPTLTLTCTTQCYLQDGIAPANCIYGISSPNTTP